MTAGVERYRRRAIEGLDINGRDSDIHNKFVVQQIIAAVDPQGTDVVLDVGCGDGLLLRSMASRIKAGKGVLPTKEEASIFRSFPDTSNVEVVVGRGDRLPFDSGTFDVIILNSVMLLLPSLAEGR